ncbi:MAG: hypothetical protein QGF46_00755 [Planctomycetota bacterium]|jgi:hypothetical protein|nr:hypothetical protein [Planctomycetota bacterium]
MRSNEINQEVKTDTMSAAKRWALIGVAVFCLLIFTVTGPMTDVLTKMFAGGPNVEATVDLPSGAVDITIDDYRLAANQKDWAERVLQQYLYADDNRESVLAYATLMKLADEMKIEITSTQLQELLQGFVSQGADAYRNFYRSFGFRTAAQFEHQVAQALRVSAVVDLLSASAVPSEQDIMDVWAETYEEMNVQYAVWHPNNFVDQAATLEIVDEDLTSFFENDLTPIQSAQLEVEQAVAFEVVLLDNEAMASDAVKAWFSPEEPTAEALDGFYASNKYLLYMRDKVGDDLDPILSREELGDRVKKDYLLHQAVTELAFELPQAEDVQAFADSKGATLIAHSDMIPLSELPDVEQIGGIQLRRLFQAEENIWMQSPVQMEGQVFLMRPTAKRDREMPELSVIRDDVLEFWRQGQQQILAQEAADSFVADLPRGEDYVEGDPVAVDADTFAAAAATAGIAVEQMGWISRTSRPSVDPFWPTDAVVLQSTRTKVGAQLGDLVDGQTMGPSDYGENGIAVAHLIGRRAANADEIWPAEYNRAKMSAVQSAYNAFQTDQISYEGLSRTYNLTKVERIEATN